MSDRIFIDSNILVYAYQQNDLHKQKQSRDILFQEADDDAIVLSTQTLGEFSNVLARNRIKIDTIEKYFKEICKTFNIVTIKQKTLSDAYRLLKKYSLSWWDSVIVATALENKCNLLYSEDFSHKLVIDNKLTVINPFL